MVSFIGRCRQQSFISDGNSADAIVDSYSPLLSRVDQDVMPRSLDSGRLYVSYLERLS